MLVTVAALVVAAPASAKEILGLQLCGQSGCATEKGPQVSAVLHEGPGGPFTDGSDGGVAVAPARPGSFYRGYALMGDQGKVFARVPFYYVPGGSALVVPGNASATTTWQHASAPWQTVIERLAQKVDAFGPPQLTRVSLGFGTAADPQSYLKLYTVGGKADTYPKDASSIQVVLESARRTPWTDGNYVVLYPKDRLLVRDGQIVSIPPEIADAAAAGASLDVGTSFPWLVVAIAASLAAVVAAALVVAGRLAFPTRRAVPQP
jgi:hypothetical protein